MIKHTDRGPWAERMARAYLESQGLLYHAHNFSCRMGEIDLIMTSHTHLIFVEVRTRRSHEAARRSIDHRKQQRLRRAATIYVQQHPKAQRFALRFDVVTIAPPYDHPTIDWIPQAF